MVYEVRGDNVNDAWDDFKWSFPLNAVGESSRNGPVLTIQSASVLEIEYPMKRVLFDPQRDANPFFHVMEFVWMMSHRWDDWIVKFNKHFINYSDDGKTFPGSYGYRWKMHFGLDQIAKVLEILKKDPTSRRCVLGMWDPYTDLRDDKSKDKPCNTIIHLRVIDGALDFYVSNRSNDAIWGMFGANCVHMTFLQELIAKTLGLGVGRYTVFTSNLHTYTNLPNYENIMRKGGGSTDLYRLKGLVPYPLLSTGESYDDFRRDANQFVNEGTLHTEWFKHVAYPIYRAYLDKDNRMNWIFSIDAPDWRTACQHWAERR